MYSVKKVNILDISSINKVVYILGCCGKDMYEKYGLNHWNNSWFKNFVIVCLCILKNNVYLVHDNEKNPIATFQTKIKGNSLNLQKLATNPHYAGKGIGSFCMNEAEKYAIDNNCSRVCLEVYDKSQHAIDFYIHRNYKIVGKTNTLKYTELLMEKLI